MLQNLFYQKKCAANSKRLRNTDVDEQRRFLDVGEMSTWMKLCKCWVGLKALTKEEKEGKEKK